MTLDGVLSTIVYTGIGIALFIGAYDSIALLVKKNHNLNREIDDHNLAVGIAVAGIFIAIAIVISGVIQ